MKKLLIAAMMLPVSVPAFSADLGKLSAKAQALASSAASLDAILLADNAPLSTKLQAAEVTPFAALAEAFQKGTTLLEPDMVGWRSGRAYFASAPAKAVAAVMSAGWHTPNGSQPQSPMAPFYIDIVVSGQVEAGFYDGLGKKAVAVAVEAMNGVPFPAPVSFRPAEASFKVVDAKTGEYSVVFNVRKYEGRLIAQNIASDGSVVSYSYFSK